jgi:hypothetical protein
MLKKSAAALVHRGLRRALSTWITHVLLEERRLRRIARGFHPELRLMTRAFFSLRGVAEHHQTLRRATAGFREGRRLRALNSWKEGAQHQLQQSTLLRRGCAALVSRGRRKAYLTWQDHAQNHSRAVMLLRRGATAMAMRSVRSAVNSWGDLVAGRAEKFRCLGVAVSEWRGSSFRRAWLTWLGGHQTVSWLRGVMNSIRFRHVRRGFNQLRAATGTSASWNQRVRRAMRLAFDTLERRFRRSWKKWRKMSRISARIMRQFGVYRKGERKRKLRGGFLEWAFRALRLATARRDREAAAAAAAAAELVVVVHWVDHLLRQLRARPAGADGRAADTTRTTAAEAAAPVNGSPKRERGAVLPIEDRRLVVHVLFPHQPAALVVVAAVVVVVASSVGLAVRSSTPRAFALGTRDPNRLGIGHR